MRQLLRSRGTYFLIVKTFSLSSPPICASRAPSFQHYRTRLVTAPLNTMSGHPPTPSLPNDILACFAALSDDMSQRIARVGEENRAGVEAARAEARVASELLREENRADNKAVREEFMAVFARIRDENRAESKAVREEFMADCRADNKAIRGDFRVSLDGLREDMTTSLVSLDTRLTTVESHLSDHARQIKTSDDRAERRYKGHSIAMRTMASGLGTQLEGFAGGWFKHTLASMGLPGRRSRSGQKYQRP
jgi:hypothetical protein